MASPFTTPGYRYATQKYPGDGVTTDFEFNFVGGYISKDHVTAYEMVNLTRKETPISSVDFEVVGTNQFRLLNGRTIPVGHSLVIRRDTPKGLPMVDYNDGAILNEYNLDMSNEQNVFSVAELIDLFWDMIDLFRDIYDLILDGLEEIDLLRQEWTEFRQWVLDQIDTIMDLITDIQNTLADHELRITDLEERMSFLEDRVTNLENLYNDLLQRIIDLENAGFITDAPFDGEIYGRQDGAWVVVPSGGTGGIPEAPIDGETYGRKDGAWEEIPLADLIDLITYTKARTIEAFVGGVFSNENEEIFRLPISEAMTCSWADHAAGVGPWRSSLLVYPTASLVISARKNDVQFGTITFATSETNGSWDNTSGNDEVSFAIGDVLTLVVTSEDISAANLGLSITGITVP